MKMQVFAAEDDLGPVPSISGDPMIASVLGPHIEALTPGQRIQQAMSTMLLDCVYQFYFAKHVCRSPQVQTEPNTDDLNRASSWLKITLLKQAVIGIGATVDTTFDRTSSYWFAVQAVQASLKAATTLTASAQATIELLKDLRGTTNPDSVTSFKYVRHLRNKWAGHASLDLQFDSWADANRAVNWAILEDAVVRMVNAFQELGTLASMSPELSTVESAWHTEGQAPNVTRMTLAWEGASSLSEVMRFMAQREAAAVISALSPASH